MSASADLPQGQSTGCIIAIGADGNRQSVEALYLELRQVAKQHGLNLKYQMTQTKPEDPSGRLRMESPPLR